MAASSSPTNVKKGPQVFINFPGAELRNNFVDNLNSALKRQGINAFVDNDLRPGENLETLFRKIVESTVALAILSSTYTGSHRCLNELVMIKDCVARGTLWVIPIFYKLKTSMVHDLDGDFGLQLWNLWRKKDHRDRDDRILKWDAALQDVGGKKALRYKENSIEVVNEITKHVQNFLDEDFTLRKINPKLQGRGGESTIGEVKEDVTYLKRAMEALLGINGIDPVTLQQISHGEDASSAPSPHSESAYDPTHLPNHNNPPSSGETL